MMADSMNTVMGNLPPSFGKSQAAVARPSVLSLAIKEKSALYAAYMPFLVNGGLFVPTTKNYQLGDEVFLILSLMDEPQKLQISGKVVWLTPPGAGLNRTQGIGLHFPGDETGLKVKTKIEQLLGSALGASRPTHTM